MKTSAFAFLLALTTSCFAGTPDTSKNVKNPVIAPPPPESDAGFFIGAAAGGFQLETLHAGDPLRLDFQYRRGGAYTIPVGYDFGNGFSTMLISGYDKVLFRLVTLSESGLGEAASTRGHVSFIPVLAGGSYNFKLIGDLSLYIGGGIGAIRETGSFTAYDRPQPADKKRRVIHFNELPGLNPAYISGLTVNDWEFGFQAFAGLSYKLSRHASVNVGYRYMYIDNHITVNGDSSDAFQGQTAELGLTWKF